ncbi:MAG: transposase [Roseiarcus sp.]
MPQASRRRLSSPHGNQADPRQSFRAPFPKETKAWLAEQPAGRFEFTFTPKHGSWLNLVEGFFSKLARSVLRHVRIASKQELKQRIIAAESVALGKHHAIVGDRDVSGRDPQCQNLLS